VAIQISNSVAENLMFIDPSETKMLPYSAMEKTALSGLECNKRPFEHNQTHRRCAVEEKTPSLRPKSSQLSATKTL